MIIYNTTWLTTELLVVDSDGNVINRKRASQSVSALTQDEFVAAYNQIVKAKAQLEKELAGDIENAISD